MKKAISLALSVMGRHKYYRFYAYQRAHVLIQKMLVFGTALIIVSAISACQTSSRNTPPPGRDSRLLLTWQVIAHSQQLIAVYGYNGFVEQIVILDDKGNKKENKLRELSSIREETPGILLAKYQDYFLKKYQLKKVSSGRTYRSYFPDESYIKSIVDDVFQKNSPHTSENGQR